MKVSYLLFDDDNLILYDVHKEHIECLSWALRWFKATLSLKINLEESESILVGRVGCKFGGPS